MQEPLSDIELLVLGLIASTPLHGHLINRIIGQTPLGRWLHVADKHVYYVLRKLEATGFATFQRETQPDAPTRKVYTATPAGREALAADIVRPARLETPDGVGFTVVFGLLPYLPEISDEEKTGLVRVRLDALTRLKETEYADGSGDFVRLHGGEPVMLLWELERARLDVELAWLDGVMNRVEQEGWRFAPPVSLDYMGGNDEGSFGS